MTGKLLRMNDETEDEIGGPESVLLDRFAAIFAAFEDTPTWRQRNAMLMDGIRAVHAYFAAKVVR